MAWIKLPMMYMTPEAIKDRFRPKRLDTQLVDRTPKLEFPVSCKALNIYNHVQGPRLHN